MEDKKMMSAQEFLEKGYLQEVNRIFFHPLGLMMVVKVSKDNVEFGGIIDCREDPVGVIFAEDQITIEKAQNIAMEWDAKAKNRLQEFGSVVQKVPNMY